MSNIRKDARWTLALGFVDRIGESRDSYNFSEFQDILDICDQLLDHVTTTQMEALAYDRTSGD